MGGIIIFTAISIPFLMLSDYDWRVGRGLRRGDAAARCSASPTTTSKIVRRRSLGTQRADEARHHDPHLGRPVVDRDRRRPACRRRCACASSTTRSTSASSPACRSSCHLPRRRGHDERGQPHRRPRRPRRRLRGDRRCWPTSGSRSSRPASTTSRCCRPASSAPASAFCGSTRSRRRSSWATPARSGWAARSPGSRS